MRNTSKGEGIALPPSATPILVTGRMKLPKATVNCARLSLAMRSHWSKKNLRAMWSTAWPTCHSFTKSANFCGDENGTRSHPVSKRTSEQLGRNNDSK